MSDTLPVDVCESITQLVRNEPRRCLVQPVMSEDVFEKVTPFNELQHERYVTGSRKRHNPCG